MRRVSAGNVLGAACLVGSVALVLSMALAGSGAARAHRRAEAAAPEEGTTPATSPKHRSPAALAFSPDGTRLAVADATAGMLCIVDVGAAKVAAEIELEGSPSGVAWAPDGTRVFVSERGAGTVAEVDPATGAVTRRLTVGLRPVGIALAPKAGLLLSADSDSDAISIVPLAGDGPSARVRLDRRPLYLAVAPDESVAVVGNALPSGSATDPEMAARVSIVDLKKAERIGEVRLPPGSANVRGIAIEPNGRWAYAVHTVGRTHVPTTQLDRGWVNTNALSIIDIPARSHLATLLLDHPMQGAADPWGVAISPDGARLFVAIAGTHQVARVELAQLHEFIDGKLPDDHRLAQAAGYSPGTENIWLRIKRDPKEKAELVNDLSSLYAADLIKRFNLPGKGPRGIALTGDGKLLAAGLYFEGKVALVDPESGRSRGTISVGRGAEPDDVRLGETVFHDASYCFQHWMSCATCHEDARVDGMNWDLLNDGIGNPKNSRSLLLGHLTPPMMSLGVRSDLAAAVKAGFVHIQFHEPEEETLRLTRVYLESLQPERSPLRLPDGSLSDAAKRGEALFLSPATDCARCHPPPLYTDLKTYGVGTRGEFDRHDEFDTPTLVEGFRTAPYLHDGSAATLREVLVERNAGDKHGKTSHLSPQEIDDLVEFLLSL